MLHKGCLCLIVCLFLLFLPTVTLLAQSSPADSLRRAFNQEKDPVNKALQYYELAQLVMKDAPEKGTAMADTLELLGKKARHPLSTGRALHLRGDALYDQGKYEESMPFYRKEMEVALEIDDLNLQGRALNKIGSVFQNTARYDSALVYLLEAAEIKEQIGDKKDIAAAYSNVGNVFSDMQLPEKSIEWLQKALDIRLSLPNGEKGAIVTYNNISIAYNGLENYDKAIEYAQRGFDLAMQTGNKFHAGVLAGSLGHLWLQKRELDKSVEMSEKAAALLTETNRKPNLVYPLVNLAEAWWRKGNNTKALEYNDQGYAIMQELKLVEPLEAYYENYANIYESLGDYKQSLAWFKKFMVLDDSLFNKEKLNAVAQAEARFENEKKEAQLVRQQLALERQTAQKRTILIIALAAILGLGRLFYFLRNKQIARQKETELAAEKAALSAQLEHAEAEKWREIDAMKSTFFANISHEFRTPLTLIVSPLRQLLDNPSERPKPSLFRTMLLSGERLLELVNQLLDLSKAEAGQLEFQPVEADVLPVLRGIAGSFTSLADVRQIHFETLTPASEIPVRFDRDKLVKIVANLLSNAFKFTPEEGRVTMEVNTLNENGRGLLELTVRDTGIGIPASELPHLFERFYQVKDTGRATLMGSGIGLALTKELVEMHGGSISVESPDTKSDGHGAAFTVRLPILLATPVMAPDHLKVEVLSSGAGTVLYPDPPSIGATVFDKTGQPQVLVVEDNPDVRLFIKDCLEKNYNVILAHDGEQGLETARKSIPDLIISDVMMPRMNGFELCQALKTDTRTSHIPVVMLTARAEKQDKIGGLETGADDYLVKPFDAGELLIRVANLIAQRQKLQAHYRSTLSPFASTQVEAESMDATFLQNVKAAIEANLDDENFSVVELGAKIGMSRSQLHRKLSALTGFSPNEAIRNMRLERAKQMLAKKAGTASEIAYLCGFSSPAYFTKCFRDYFGVTPGEV